MPKFSATLAFSVQCYSTIEFEAADEVEAIATAKRLALEPEGWDVAYDTSDDHRVVDLTDEESGEVVAEDLAAEAA